MASTSEGQRLTPSTFIPIYSNPKDTYQKFVNAFQQKEGRLITKEKIMTLANKKWKEIKKNPEEVKSFIESAPKATGCTNKKYTQKSLQGFFSAGSAKTGNSSQEELVKPELNTQPASSQLKANVTPESNEVYLNRENFISGQEAKLCEEFLNEILGVDAKSVLKDDPLWKEIIFKQTILATAKAWNVFFSLSQKYDINRQKSKTSSLQKSLQNINAKISEVKKCFAEISEISVNASVGVSVLAANLTKKMAKLMEAVKLLAEITSLTSDKNLLRSLRRRIRQQEETMLGLLHRRRVENCQINCMNSSSLTWEDALSSLETLQNGNKKFKMSNAMLTIEEVIKIGTMMSEATAVSIEELKLYLPARLITATGEILNSALKQLLIAYPLLLMKRSGHIFLINMHQMEFNCDELDLLFGLTKEPVTQSKNDEEVKIETNTERKPGKKGGRPSVVSKFPEIPTVATEFIKNNGYRAQERRRETTFQSCGVTIAEIRDHLLQEIPGLKEHGLGLNTVRYLFKPVKRGTFAAERYKGYIDAKVAPKDNSFRSPHINGHYLFSRIKLRGELATMCQEEVTSVSCDTMNKVKVGTLAVSRYHQIRKIFLDEDRPVYNDHDFPLIYKLIPDGIMILEPVKGEHGLFNSSMIHSTNNGKSTDDLSLACRLSRVDHNEFLRSFEQHQAQLDMGLLRAGFEIKDTAADGNCLFETISWEMSNRMSLSVTASQLRETICDHLINEIDEYIGFFVCANDETKRADYIREVENMKSPGVWNNQLLDLVLHAVSSMYDLTIFVYTSLKGVPILIISPRVKCNPVDQSIIYVAFNACPGHEHYSRVTPVTEKSKEVTIGQTDSDNDSEENIAMDVDQVNTSSDEGNVRCEDKDDSGSGTYITDRLGREHLKCAYTGPVLTYIRNNIFHNNTCLEHVNDLLPICVESVKNGKTVLICYVDNGPDYSPTSVKNILLYGRLWQAADLDIFTAVSHASGWSAHNFIEHAWSMMSRRLTCVTFSACEEGEDLPPYRNSKLSDSERKSKEMKILDKAAHDLCSYWTGATFDEFPVIPLPVLSSGRDNPIPTADDIVSFIEAPLRDIRAGKHKAVLEEFRFLSKHADRRHNEITFSKCQFSRDTICDYCHKNPVRSKKVLDVLRQAGGRLFEPTPSTQFDDHYMTFLEMYEKSKSGEKLATADEHLPSELIKDAKERLGACSVCPAWMFTSKTEKDRHNSVLHKTKKTQAISSQSCSSSSRSVKHTCRYDGCNRIFKTYHQLNVHRKAECHFRNKRKKAASRQSTAEISKRARSTITGHFRVSVSTTSQSKSLRDERGQEQSQKAPDFVEREESESEEENESGSEEEEATDCGGEEEESSSDESRM